ncbi:MAG TPA: class I SAM-dependent methyltransferase [Chloroflexota bacterium]|nr:class I SAM-dependent methyltransferase [Chloroflexota bacterium]
MSTGTDSAAAHFDRVAAAYASSPVHARGEDLPWMLETLAPQPTWRVLDVGTGAGHAAMTVAPGVARVTAVDVAPRMLAVTAQLCADRGIGNVDTREINGRDLPFETGAFDAAISRFSAHHWREPEALVGEIARVLPIGAPFVLIDSVSPEERAHDSFLAGLELLRDPSHGRNDTVAEWRRRFIRHGFELAQVRTWMLELDTEEWLQRSATVSWRSGACRSLLAEAPPETVIAFAIKDGGARFSIPCAVLQAARL